MMKEPNNLGFVTINGEQIIVRKPTLGQVMDRLTSQDPESSPIDALTIPALCIGKTEEWLRTLDIDDAAAIFEMTSGVVQTVKKIALGLQNVKTDTNQQH